MASIERRVIFEDILEKGLVDARCSGGFRSGTWEHSSQLNLVEKKKPFSLSKTRGVEATRKPSMESAQLEVIVIVCDYNNK